MSGRRRPSLPEKRHRTHFQRLRLAVFSRTSPRGKAHFRFRLFCHFRWRQRRSSRFSQRDEQSDGDRFRRLHLLPQLKKFQRQSHFRRIFDPLVLQQSSRSPSQKSFGIIHTRNRNRLRFQKRADRKRLALQRSDRRRNDVARHDQSGKKDRLLRKSRNFRRTADRIQNHVQATSALEKRHVLFLLYPYESHRQRNVRQSRFFPEIRLLRLLFHLFSLRHLFDVADSDPEYFSHRQ